MVLNFILLQLMLTSGFLHSDAARYRIGMQMSALAQEIREDCVGFKVGEENAEKAEEK